MAGVAWACVASLWGVLAVIGWPGVGLAEDPETSGEVVKTEDVVVSATKTEVPVSHLTSAVEVITGEELQRRSLKTVAEALRFAEGISFVQFGGPGTLATARMRGGNPEQTLVLIDGAIVNSATAGSFDFSSLTTDNIERIEILRGNQSMLWGSDALGGVINITTKRGTGPPKLGAFQEYGSFQSLREGASLSGQKGPVDVSATLTRWDVTSFSAINYRRGATERDGFHNWQGSGRLGVALPKEGRLDFDVRWLQSLLNIDGFNGANPADVLGAINRRDQYVFTGSYRQPFTDWWKQKLTAGRYQEKLFSHPGTFFRDLRTGATGVPSGSPVTIHLLSNRIEWQHNVQVAPPLLVTAGYQFREQQGENDPRFTNRIISSHAGFAEAQLDLWDRVFGTAGLRQDAYNVFGNATTYRVTGGYLHKETGTKLRGSYATGFRAPTLNQLFFPGFGNPNLQPEKSQGLDAGVDQYLFDQRVTLSTGYFWTRYRNLILSVFNPAVCGPLSSSGFCAQNIGLAKAQGWESSVKVVLARDLPWIKSLDFHGQYTYTITRDLQRNVGRRLPQWPVNQWSAVVSYQPIEPLRVNVEFRYMGERFNDALNAQKLQAFDVWNLAATYDLTKRVQVYTRVDNLFDRRYEEILFFGTPIRSIYGGVKVNFDLG
ncbi:TonB-dependent receptor plug domain-containing protein [Nitrospira sp. Kam-Ns4a]